MDNDAQPPSPAAPGAAAEAAAPAAEASPEADTAAPTEGVVAASPAANKILTEKGVDVADVPGSGRDGRVTKADAMARSEEHTSELQSRGHLVCRLLLEKKNTIK